MQYAWGWYEDIAESQVQKLFGGTKQNEDRKMELIDKGKMRRSPSKKSVRLVWLAGLKRR